jgi:polar amino acid transport system substrate-binding protein
MRRYVMRLKGISVLVLALAFVSGLQAQTKLDQIKKSGKLVIGTSADFPPYEFHVQASGKDQIVGFDIAVAKEIAADLGVKLEIKDMSFDGLLAALQAGTIDLVLAGMNPTDERKKAVDFSDVYYVSKQGVMVRTADKAKYATKESLKDVVIGAQKGAIQVGLAKELKGVPKADQDKPNAQVKELAKVSDLVLELKFKKIEAIAMEWAVGDAYAEKNPDVCMTSIVLQADGGSAVAFKKGAPEFVAAVNKTLARLVQAKAVDKFVAQATDLIE